MINNYNEYVDYFRSLASRHVDVKGFVFGDTTHILSELKDRIDYPVCVLESPEIRHAGTSDEMVEQWSGAIEILNNSEADNHEAESGNLHLCLEISRAFRNKMIESAEDDDLQLDISRMALVPVASVSFDNLWGWRLDFVIDVYSGYCLSEKFN